VKEFRDLLEGRIFEHSVIATKDISFSPELLKACEQNTCGKYNNCWSCPPAIGSMEALQEKILGFSHAFVFTTKTAIEDSFDFEGMMSAKEYHDKLTLELHDKFGKTNPVYGAGACRLCDLCAYPQPCRFPGRVFPAVEAAGIDVTELSRAGGLRYNNGANTVTFFSMVVFNDNTPSQ